MIASSYLQQKTHAASSQQFSLLTFAMPALLEELSTGSSLHAMAEGPEAGNRRFVLCSLCYWCPISP